jgi:hypothetical protein
VSDAPAPIRRVLAALDASTPARETLRTAAALAERLHAELEALLFEDPELRRVMGLPSSRHVSLPGGAALDAGAVTASLEASVRRLRADVEQAASGARLRWSLRVVEGEAEAGDALGGEGSLLVLDRASWLSPTGMLGRAAAASPAGRPVLVLGSLPRPAISRGPPRIWAIWDASAGARSALGLALQLSGEGGEPPHLLVAAGDLAEAECRAVLARGPVGREPLPWRWAGGALPGDLVRALPLDAFLVVDARIPAVGGPAGRDRLLRAARGPVLLLG